VAEAKAVTYHGGEHVRVRVVKITPTKVFVRLPNGRSGMIRQREISWTEERPDLHKVTRVGETLEAVVLPRFGSDSKVDEKPPPLELSLRLAKFNPWKKCVNECQEGQVVEGVVKRVRRFGAFIELALEHSKGIEGFLPVEEISPCWLEEAQQALWPGDVVQAVVTEFDPGSFRLRLSIKSYLIRTKEALDAAKDAQPQEATFAEHLRSRDLQKLRQLLEDGPRNVAPPTPQRIRRLLVVDDQDAFREQMVAVLRGWGYHVEGAATLQEAEAKFSVGQPGQTESVPFDGVFLDLSLQGEVSVTWAKAVREKWPECQILILSGKEIEARDLAEIEALALPLEYKPFFVEDLVNYLQRWEEENPNPSAVVSSSEAPAAPARDSKSGGRGGERAYTDQDLIALLRDLAERNHCQGAALFVESREQPGQVVVLAASGVEIEQSDERLSMLWYSPVGEVLRGKEKVSIGDSVRQHRYARYLREAVRHFRAAWGWRVTSPILGKPAAFFLFSHHVAEDERRPAVGPTLLHKLETFLDRLQILQVLEAAQEEMLRSQLRAGALHDVRNTLGTLDLSLHNLSQQIQALSSVSRDVALADLSADISGLLDDIQSAAAQMKRTLDLFRSLEDKHQSAETDIHVLIRQSLARFQPMADNLGVELRFKPAKSLPSGYFSAARLRQILDNLILNAIQWSGRDPRCGSSRILKEVTVSTRYAQGKKLPVRIYVADTGPGIHQALMHHKIYEFGYSQREGGSGLGLFIAKILVEAMGGEIRVVRSVMEVGSIFRIRLPETEDRSSEGSLSA